MQYQTDNMVSKIKILKFVFCITLLAVLGVASVTPAFPKLANELGLPPQKIALLITVFALPGVMLTPVFGMIADHYGRKKVLVPSLLLFGIAGGMCTFVYSFKLLLLLRFFQGIGAASIGSLNITVICDIYSGKERTIALGYNASILSIATAVYPVIGGFLAVFGSHYPFALAIMAIPIGLVILIFFDYEEPRCNQAIGEYLNETLNIIRIPNVITLFLTGTFVYVIFYGVYLAYIPFYMEKTFESSALVIGLVMSSMSITDALVSLQLKRIIMLCNEKMLLQIALILYIVAIFIIPFITVFELLFIPIILFGIAHGICLPTIQTFLARFAPSERRAVFLSLNGVSLRLGQVIGSTLSSIAYVCFGIKGVFYIFSGIMALILLVISISTNEGRTAETKSKRETCGI